MDERAQKIKADIDAVMTIDDPQERARVVTELLEVLRESNAALAKSRREAIKDMRAAGLSYGKIGKLLGVDRSRVYRLESGEPTGATARSRAARKEAAGE